MATNLRGSLYHGGNFTAKIIRLAAARQLSTVGTVFRAANIAPGWWQAWARGWPQRWAEPLLTLLYPDLCQVCKQERATPAEGYVGPMCRKQVRFIVPPMCDRCGLPFPGAITDDFACANCQEVKLHFSRARASVAAQGM